MEIKRISQLPALQSPGPDDDIPIVSGGTTQRVTAERLIAIGKGEYTWTGLTVAAGSSATFDLTGFVNAAWCWRLEVTETGGGATGLFDVEMHATDLFDGTETNGRLLYKAEGIDPAGPFIDQGGFQYEDQDAARTLHIRLTNHDAVNQATFSVTITV